MSRRGTQAQRRAQGTTMRARKEAAHAATSLAELPPALARVAAALAEMSRIVQPFAAAAGVLIRMKMDRLAEQIKARDSEELGPDGWYLGPLVVLSAADLGWSEDDVSGLRLPPVTEVVYTERDPDA